MSETQSNKQTEKQTNERWTHHKQLTLSSTLLQSKIKWWIYQIDEIFWRLCLFRCYVWFAYFDNVRASNVNGNLWQRLPCCMCMCVCATLCVGCFIFCSAKFTKAINNFYAQIRLQILCALFAFLLLLLHFLCILIKALAQVSVCVCILFDFHDTSSFTLLLILFPPVMNYALQCNPKSIAPDPNTFEECFCS